MECGRIVQGRIARRRRLGNLQCETPAITRFALVKESCHSPWILLLQHSYPSMHNVKAESIVCPFHRVIPEG